MLYVIKQNICSAIEVGKDKTLVDEFYDMRVFLLNSLSLLLFSLALWPLIAFLLIFPGNIIKKFILLSYS